ncbi:MAG: 3-keto-5-aminohexanoate cleavage protein [candidate division Zixibacteria bacterium]|nr:3-keto-5-aminohexanoate cleavage protein [candidate division Zixibacteria bacterium]
MITTDKLIICVAPLGSFMGKDMNPNIPIQPKEIAEEVYRAWNEGASIAHIHARDENGVATTAPEVFREIGIQIRKKGCDIIQQFSTSPGREPGSKVEDGLRSIEANPEMASVDVGVQVAIRRGEEKLFLWTRSFVEKSLQTIYEKGIKPELEIFTPGGMEEINVYIEKGLLRKPYWINFVLDMQRTQQNSVRYTPKNLMHYVDLIPPESMFTTMGIGSSELPAAIQSILLGGHVRVGFEDNLMYRKGVLAESNAQLVARVALIARELGCDPASPNEARDLLGIPKLGN